jgi:hypothetical protein
MINSNLSELKSGLILHRVFEQNVTIPAGGTLRITHETAINGYIPLGFLSIAASQSSYIFPGEWQLASGVAYITLHNKYTQALSSRIVFGILYLKS